MIEKINTIYDGGGGKAPLNHWFLPLCGGDCRG